MNHSPVDAATFARNFAMIAEQSQRIVQEFAAKNVYKGGFGQGDALHMGGAVAEWFARAASEPQKMLELQMGWWQDTLNLWQHTAQKFLGEDVPGPVIAPDAKDRRFKDKAWQESLVFDFIKQSYLLTAEWAQRSVKEVGGMDRHSARKMEFYTRQFVDALAPSNFLFTNPEVIKATLETGGENLVHGLANLLSDLEQSRHSLKVSMTDANAFEVSRNLALTPGKVIYQNELMQLIQYEPATEAVFRKPLLIIPAWINKFYILDLRPENSIVKFLVEHGYTVFVISWVNPDAKLGLKRFDDYMMQGPLAALEAIEAATGEKEINAVGYCLGGTLLATTIAWLTARKQASRISSACYLTTMLDFSEAGELSVFIDEEQLRALETRMSEKGYLEGEDMAGTFNMLRANDLIWSFVVNNYLLGKDPFPFDLLYWNADSTRMPYVMHSFYLRNMYQRNLLKEPGGLTIAGEPIHLEAVNTPAYFLSAREDHIAPWKSTYAGTRIFKGPVRFVLAGSGHIAGVINPPGTHKYSHWLSDTLPQSPAAFLENATEVKGSWWPDFMRWNKPFCGELVPARKPGEGKLKVIEPAPGSYVKVKS